MLLYAFIVMATAPIRKNQPVPGNERLFHYPYQIHYQVLIGARATSCNLTAHGSHFAGCLRNNPRGYRLPHPHPRHRPKLFITLCEH